MTGIAGTVLDCTPGMRHDNFCDGNQHERSDMRGQAKTPDAASLIHAPLATAAPSATAAPETS